MTTNREIRPSKADMWMPCTGAPALIESLDITDSSSFYGDEGTLAHELGASALDAGEDSIANRLGEVHQVNESEVEVTDDMVRAVDEYIESINLASFGHKLLVEHKIDCGSVLGKGRSGTADAIIVPEDEGFALEFHDFKYGQGVEVFAEKNRQLLIYGSSFINSHSLGERFSQVKFVIHQPRIKSAPDEWLVDIDKVLKWAELAKKKAKAAHYCKPGENLVAGETQCRWCPAKHDHNCPAFEAVAESIFDDIDELSEHVTVPTEHDKIAAKYDKVPLVEMWLKTVKAAAYKVLDDGEDLPGYKFVEGRRGNREWTDEKEAAARVARYRVKRQDMYDFNLKSPSKISKVITKAQFEKLQDEGLIEQAPGNPTIAPESDSRPTIVKGKMFDNLDENDDLM